MGLTESWLVTPELGPRPAGKPTECFYCQAPLGVEHRHGCVMRAWPCVVYIRRNRDGEVRRSVEHHWCVDLDSNEYLWSDGNNSCDCNRQLYFARAHGEPEDWDHECSDGAYTILKIELQDGRVVYSEE